MAHDTSQPILYEDKGMSDKQEVNCIFAIHFDDINDPRYKVITEIMMGGDMWVKRNLVYAEHLDSRDELCAQIEKLEYKDE